MAATPEGEVVQALIRECKAPGQVPTPVQAREHERIRRTGTRVYVCDSECSVEYVLRHIANTIEQRSIHPDWR